MEVSPIAKERRYHSDRAQPAKAAEGLAVVDALAKAEVIEAVFGLGRIVGTRGRLLRGDRLRAINGFCSASAMLAENATLFHRVYLTIGIRSQWSNLATRFQWFRAYTIVYDVYDFA